MRVDCYIFAFLANPLSPRERARVRGLLSSFDKLTLRRQYTDCHLQYNLPFRPIVRASLFRMNGTRRLDSADIPTNTEEEKLSEPFTF